MCLHTCCLQFLSGMFQGFFFARRTFLDTFARSSNHELHIELRPDDDSAYVKAVFADGSTWDVSTMTAQQWRLMPARRAQHGKKEATVCWLGEHAVSHHKLAVQFRRQSGRTDIVVLLEQTKQVCQCTLRSVTGKGDTEEQARKNAEELMTNVAKNFATGSIGRSDLFSYRNDLLKAGGWTKEEAVEKRPRDAPDDLVDATLEKSTPCTEVKKDVECTENVGNLIFTMPEIPWDSFQDELARTSWETHVSDS